MIWPDFRLKSSGIFKKCVKSSKTKQMFSKEDKSGFCKQRRWSKWFIHDSEKLTTKSLPPAAARITPRPPAPRVAPQLVPPPLLAGWKSMTSITEESSFCVHEHWVEISCDRGWYSWTIWLYHGRGRWLASTVKIWRRERASVWRGRINTKTTPTLEQQPKQLQLVCPVSCYCNMNTDTETEDPARL